MFIVDSYSLAVIFCVVTMLCWGSWGNTQKLAGKTWRYELFYWDYVIGILAFSLLLGFTLGSTGDAGRGFVEDLKQISMENYASAFAGGVIFNLSNILLSASVSMAGLTVAFPLGVGIALVLGVFVNYFGEPKGDAVILFSGVALVVLAIIFNAIAAGKMNQKGSSTNKKGIIIAIIAGVLMSFFYRFVAAAMDLNNFESPTPTMATPYSAFFIFAIGIFISNFIINTIVMKKPFVGTPVSYKEYFQGKFSTHMVGVLGGAIWGLGTALSYIAAGKATHNAPQKVSPAAVVSTALTLGTGTSWNVSFSLINAPLEPRVITTMSTPLALMISAALRALSQSVTLTPERISASVSLGMIMYRFCSSLLESARAGAGFSITLMPCSLAIWAAYSTVSIGISNCISRISPFSMVDCAFRMSSGLNEPLAPEAMAMLFSPFISTIINATPEGSVGSE